MLSLAGMPSFSLTPELEAVIERIRKTGRYGNASEIIRAGLRALEEKENAHLNPLPISQGALGKAYARESKESRQREVRLARRSVQKPEAA